MHNNNQDVRGLSEALPPPSYEAAYSDSYYPTESEAAAHDAGWALARPID